MTTHKLNGNDKLLAKFLDEHFDFYGLRKAGFFHKEMKKSDIHGQAERICTFFGYKTVYEYGANKIRGHISYAQDHRPLYINDGGKLIEEPFITEIGGIYD